MRDQGPPTAGSAREVLNSATLLLRPDEVVFEAMLQGWTRQMSARNLAFSTTTNRVQTVRRFFARHHVYPWHWTPALVDEWVFDLRTMRRYSKASVRSAQVCLRGFCDYLIDPAYEWPDTCQALFGTAPMQILTEVNAAAHVADYEGEPSRRAFTRAELTTLFDYLDFCVASRPTRGVKGWLSVFRDSVVFKTAYGFGTRRNETRMLDLVDLSPNPHAPQFGDYGVLAVRYGKAQRGSAPKRRSVLTVWPWTAAVLQQWVEEVRPQMAHASGPALFPSERADRLAVNSLNERLRQCCTEAGLDPALGFHSFRRAYVTHLFEDNWDPRFVQEQVGHEHASTTSLYTCVSSDFRVRTLRQALEQTARQAQRLLPPNNPKEDH